MALNFPNQIRNFEPGRACVSFWGSDAALEIAFQIEIAALQKLDAGCGDGEAQILATFDRHRTGILNAAAAAYGKRRANYHRLTAADVTAPR